MAGDDDRPGGPGTVAVKRLDGRQAVERVHENQPWLVDPAGELVRACWPEDSADQKSRRKVHPKEHPVGEGGVNDSEVEVRLGKVGWVWFDPDEIDVAFPPDEPGTVEGRGGRPGLPERELIALLELWAEEDSLTGNWTKESERLARYRRALFPDKPGEPPGIYRNEALAAAHKRLTGRRA